MPFRYIVTLRGAKTMFKPFMAQLRGIPGVERAMVIQSPGDMRAANEEVPVLRVRFESMEPVPREAIEYAANLNGFSIERIRDLTNA
jgi:hypothetical protein